MKNIDDLASKVHACIFAYGQWPTVASIDAARLILAELNEIMPDGVAFVEAVDGSVQMCFVGKTVDVVDLMPDCEIVETDA